MNQKHIRNLLDNYIRAVVLYIFSLNSLSEFKCIKTRSQSITVGQMLDNV